MTYPAFEQIGQDIALGHARWRVYRALMPPTLDFVEPRQVKVWLLADQLKMSKRTVIRALEWLTDSGYVVERSRDGRRSRSLTLAWAVKQAA